LVKLCKTNTITPFKITDFGTNRKPLCDFLLVNNTKLHIISHRFHDMRSTGQILADRVCLSLTHLFQVKP